MQSCVVAYPELAPADRKWIERLRKRHDPRFTMIAPHWTLIFPTAGIDAATLTGHVRAVAARFAPFAFTLRCALPIRDTFSPLTHLFLSPDAGFGQLVRLHDALYAGPLDQHLRLDLPYIPHITIGAFAEPLACKAAADQLNQKDFAISGRIGNLSILTVTPAGIALSQQITLGAN